MPVLRTWLAAIGFCGFVMAGWIPAGPVFAGIVESSGPLTDEEFYRLIACAASPGGRCRKTMLHWSEAAT
jgi:hypothetical protein